jgi:hypothetical protein
MVLLIFSQKKKKINTFCILSNKKSYVSSAIFNSNIMKNFFTLAFICLTGQFGLMANNNNSMFVPSHFIRLLAPPPENCDSILASFVPSKQYSEPNELVSFNNQSTNYHRSEWYIEDSLVSTSTHLSYTFLADGHYDVELKVFDAEDVCMATFEMEQHVHSPIHFCGDLELPDQDPSECECMTTYDVDENGEFVATTEYRWRDRSVSKYRIGLCN